MNQALAFQSSVFQIRKAERRKAKLRLALSGPSGSGKTLSALLIAYGITGDWTKIGLIDTENGRGELYVGLQKAGMQIGEYLYGRLLPPYSPDRYIQAMQAMDEAGAEVIIIDSLSHAWSGEGGVLDIQGQLASRGGNSFDAWRKASPLHSKLVDALILSQRHIIATLRTKQEYVVEKVGDQTKVRKVGLAPVQRDGLEYEFTLVLDLAMDHSAEASKDNTDMFDGKLFKPTVATGQALLQWLEIDTVPDGKPQPATGGGRLQEMQQTAAGFGDHLEANSQSEETGEHFPPSPNPVEPTEGQVAAMHHAWDALGVPIGKREAFLRKKRPWAEWEDAIKTLDEKMAAAQA